MVSILKRRSAKRIWHWCLPLWLRKNFRMVDESMDKDQLGNPATLRVSSNPPGNGEHHVRRRNRNLLFSIIIYAAIMVWWKRNGLLILWNTECIPDPIFKSSVFKLWWDRFCRWSSYATDRKFWKNWHRDSSVNIMRPGSTRTLAMPVTDCKLFEKENVRRSVITPESVLFLWCR